MNTSSKILFSFIAFLLLIAITMMIVLRANIVRVDADGNPYETISGNGKVVIQSRDIGAFNRIHSKDDFDIVLTQGDSITLAVESDENLQEYVQPEIKDSVLILHTKATTRNITRQVYYLTFREVDKIEMYGHGSLRGSGKMTFDQLSVVGYGSGDLNIQVEANKMNVELGGNTDLNVSGTSPDFYGSIGGSGSINGPELQTRTAGLDVAGSGTAHLAVSEKLRASVGGSGKVRYIGDPEVTKSVGGTGSVRQVKPKD